MALDGDIKTLTQQLLVTPLVRCDEAPWSFFGLSMAGWNALISLDIIAVALISLKSASKYPFSEDSESIFMTEEKVNTNRTDLERYIRVDHAGERAAQQIYRGQLVVLGQHEMGDEIRHMMEQEVEHLETFDRLINERKVRPLFSIQFGGCRVYAQLDNCGNGAKGCHGMHNRGGRGDWRTLSKTGKKSRF